MNVNDLFERLHLPVESRLPAFDGATEWVNSEPPTPADLQGKVVMVDFGTFTCINWIRTLPYIRAWVERYRDHGLVTIGVQTPEFDSERDLESVRRSLAEMRIVHPVAVDNDYVIWEAFANQYWPALYIADHEGRIRHHHFGEGNYDKSERVIQRLLTDAGATGVPSDHVTVDPQGIEVQADWHSIRSPETYVGLARSEGFASPGGPAFDQPREYTVPPRLHTNEWAFAGNWTFHRENAVSNEAPARLAFQFHARDLHLILAPPARDSSVRFRVTLEGGPPGAARGVDIDEDGNGVVSELRLYQLIRQDGRVRDKRFEIEFLDPGASAQCFTFG